MSLIDCLDRIRQAFDGSQTVPVEETQKYSIGYQMNGDHGNADFIAMADKFRDRKSEVFFPMPGDSSGRVPVGINKNVGIDELLKMFCKDLDALKEIGIPGVLLFNPTCYGGNVTSYGLFQHVMNSIKMVQEHISLIGLTTTSMPIAELVKANAPDVKVRASINMYLNSIQQMDLCSRYFDGFYLGRELNRDLSYVRKVREWCNENGKSLHLLANSGCLYSCPFRQFHNNAVSHHREILGVKSPVNVNAFLCGRELTETKNFVHILRSTWIRPEDIHHYAGLVDTIKLATRVSEFPDKVLKAYCEEHYDGDLLEILEPGHSNVPNIPIFRNSKFPKDWFEHTSHCGHHCDTCDYCKQVLTTIVEYPEYKG